MRQVWQRVASPNSESRQMPQLPDQELGAEEERWAGGMKYFVYFAGGGAMSDVQAQITNFRPVRIGGWLHFPERLSDGGIYCACGKQFECDARLAPINAPYPRAVAGMAAFEQHVAEVSHV